METLITALCDRWRPLQKWRFIVVGSTCAVMFVLGLVCCTRKGVYIVNSLDLHMYPWVAFFLIIAMCSCVVIFYPIIYVWHDVKLMMGDSRVYILALIVMIPAAIHWLILPCTSITMIVFSGIRYYFPVNYPIWTKIFGLVVLVLVLLPLLVVPIVILVLGASEGKLWQTVRPDHRWGPHLSRHRVKATHLPHIKVGQPSAEGIRLTNKAPLAHDM